MIQRISFSDLSLKFLELFWQIVKNCMNSKKNWHKMFRKLYEKNKHRSKTTILTAFYGKFSSFQK